MYICLCNGHKERDIQHAARSGTRCVRAIYQQLGGLPRCGRCLPMAERLVAGVHAVQATGGVDPAPCTAVTD